MSTTDAKQFLKPGLRLSAQNLLKLLLQNKTGRLIVFLQANELLSVAYSILALAGPIICLTLSKTYQKASDIQVLWKIVC